MRILNQTPLEQLEDLTEVNEWHSVGYDKIEGCWRLYYHKYKRLTNHSCGTKESAILRATVNSKEIDKMRELGRKNKKSRRKWTNNES